CLLAAILIGTFGTMVFRSDEVSTSEIQAMSLEEYEALVKRRDQLNVTIDRFKSTWTDKLRSIDDATANR
ncbi:MAG: hypothetical protein GTO63_28910, partial [Anaerolineae bacterium]|nr:hypothetical protein [Anaerolineae bacterium]NIQ81676.1 hypothetical protein [Anaerolineae bacterium]